MQRISNPYGPLMDSIFDVKLPVYVFRVKHIYQDGDECAALYHYPGYNGKNKKTHVILVSEKYSDTLEKMLGCLFHEYIHIWQHENGYRFGHGEKTQFKPWARYLLDRYWVIV